MKMNSIKKPRVLLVEDREDVTGAFERIFKIAFKSLQLECVSTVREAIDRMKKNEDSYDLVISDIGFDAENGNDALQAAIKNKIPAIAMSGARGVAIDKDVLKEVIFLPKPFDLQELRNAIDEKLSKA